MKLNNPKIGRTRSSFFTKMQKDKLEAGIQIFHKALQHKHFIESVLQFQWTNKQNKRFHRFYHASGLSNRQIIDRLQEYDKYFDNLGIPSQLVVLPFNTRKEIQNYSSMNNPIIWISLNCINNDWYTPVHVASAICHELAVLLDLDSTLEHLSNPEYKAFSAPSYLGRLTMQTAKLWKDSITDVGDAFSCIDRNQYNYFAASTVLGNIYSKSVSHSQANFDSLINTLLSEQEGLIELQEKLTVSETTRLVCIEEVLLKLNSLKDKLRDCSLDGSELDYQTISTSKGNSRRTDN